MFRITQRKQKMNKREAIHVLVDVALNLAEKNAVVTPENYTEAKTVLNINKYDKIQNNLEKIIFNIINGENNGN